MEVDPGIAMFYRSLIPKYLPCNGTRYAPHVMVVREEKEEPVNKAAWGKYEGARVPFLYSPVVHQGKVYYWLNVFCVRLEDIRIELGLPAVSQYTLPPEGFKKFFHCTIANTKGS